MESVLVAALLAASSSAAAAPAPLDLSCYRLMAELAGAADPRLRDAGRIGAQFFLGRIDDAAPGFNPDDGVPVAGTERAPLLRRCGEAMEAGGIDARIGERLASPRRPEA